ncbi:hypothetical protein [Halomonas cupida]|uniref:hypothetical protein n=1 Tax=Halomonas cupida TaxID=44933 RepID=UPI003A92915B
MDKELVQFYRIKTSKVNVFICLVLLVVVAAAAFYFLQNEFLLVTFLVVAYLLVLNIYRGLGERGIKIFTDHMEAQFEQDGPVYSITYESFRDVADIDRNIKSLRYEEGGEERVVLMWLKDYDAEDIEAFFKFIDEKVALATTRSFRHEVSVQFS